MVFSRRREAFLGAMGACPHDRNDCDVTFFPFPFVNILGMPNPCHNLPYGINARPDTDRPHA
jgi:hypothetical protein